jgi:hypothetical protein
VKSLKRQQQSTDGNMGRKRLTDATVQKRIRDYL